MHQVFLSSGTKLRCCLSRSAYVEFMRKEAADNALSLDGTSFMSRLLKVIIAGKRILVFGSSGRLIAIFCLCASWKREVSFFFF